MVVVAALMIGVLFASAIYLLLRRSMIKLLLGFVLLGHATSLLFFLVGRDWQAATPQPTGEMLHRVDAPGAPDPLAQSLIVVAMVLGLTFITFLLVLIYRANWEVGSDDLDDITATDRL